MIKIKRALISVSDKTGVLDFARKLTSYGVEILSTGGTAKLLQGAGLNVREVSDYTGFPEMLDGRVKTLHPKIFGGLLAIRDNKEHISKIKEHDIELIDMVVVNLYPFEKVIKKKSVSLDEAIENIDIGGPSMLRAAAKNYKNVAVISNPQKYKEIIHEMDINSGILSDAVLFGLAIDTFAHCSQYDTIIHHFLNSRFKGNDFSGMPETVSLRFRKIQDLRYGENPHQSAAFYRDEKALGGLAGLKQLHGKELSFNNILDLNAAINCIRDFQNPAAVIIKHNNPTGLAEDIRLSAAYKGAHSCDPTSAFGGIIALNRTVDNKTAELINKSGFMECVIAPSFQKGALKILKNRKNIRLLELNIKSLKSEDYDVKKVQGGMLLQGTDTKNISEGNLKVVTKLKPTKAQIKSFLFGWKAIKHIKSNAIILVKGTKIVGIGCGQTSRVESIAIAIKKAGKNAKGAFMISDAFLPKTDNIELAAKAGIKAIIQTGGSIEDDSVIKEADKRKMAMVVTSSRHFKH